MRWEATTRAEGRAKDETLPSGCVERSLRSFPPRGSAGQRLNGGSVTGVQQQQNNNNEDKDYEKEERCSCEDSQGVTNNNVSSDP